MKKKKMFKDMNKAPLILIAAVFLFLGLASQGMAATVKCDADADTFINACPGGCLMPQGCPTQPEQKNCRMHVRTFRRVLDNHSKNQRPIIKFDIESADIPTGATINRVELGVRYFGYCQWEDPVGRSIGVYRMTDPNADDMWDECTAVWTLRSAVDWASNSNNPPCPFPNGAPGDPCYCGGGDFDDVTRLMYGPDPYASALIVDPHTYIAESSVWMRFNGPGLVQLVDDWVNNGAPNHGVMLRDTEEIWEDVAQDQNLAPLWLQTRAGEFTTCRCPAGWQAGNNMCNMVTHGGPYLIVTYDDPNPPDSDGDGVPDVYDNCRDTENGPNAGPYDAANNRQYDTDADGWGNVCDCDLDNNLPPGIVSGSDLNIFVDAWLSTPLSNRDADFDSNGGVTGTDLNIFVGRWLTTEPWF